MIYSLTGSGTRYLMDLPSFIFLRIREDDISRDVMVTTSPPVGTFAMVYPGRFATIKWDNLNI